MINQSFKFWVRCPHCKQTAGISPRFVLQYLKRIMDQRKRRLAAAEELLVDVQKDLDTERINAARERAG
jgi:hypothetical protein